MGFLSRSRQPATSKRWSSGYNNPWVIPPNSQSGPFAGSLALGAAPENSLAVPAVYASVRLLSTVVSSLPLQLVKADTGKPVTGKKMPIIDDPFGGESQWFGPTLTKRQGFAQTVSSLAMRGNCFCYVNEFDANGMPTRLQILDPSRITLNTHDDDPGVTWNLDGEKVQDSKIVHFKGTLTLPGSPVGESPIEWASRTISLASSAEEFARLFFQQGAQLGGLIEMPAEMSMQQAAQLQAMWESAHSGLNNAHVVGVLSGGAKFSPVTVSPEEAQFLATIEAKSNDIAMLFGIPPHMLGQVDRTTSWGKGIAEQTLGFLKYTVRGYTDPIEDMFSRLLPPGLAARFDFSELLRPDATERWNMYQLSRNVGGYTINEIRGFEGLDPVDGGDDIFAPLNSAHSTVPGWTPEGDLGDNFTPPGGQLDPNMADDPQNAGFAPKISANAAKSKGTK